MKALALALALLSLRASAESDAPLDVRIVEAGAPAPSKGVWMSEQTAILEAQRIKACETERDALRAAPETGFPWWSVGIVLLLGVGGGVLIGRATMR
jgi:hypothetical protein